MIILIKILAMALSFAGLCALVHHRLGVSGTSAPLASACGVIVLLMLGGMVGTLDYIWWVLFAGGLAGFAWRYPVKKQKPCWIAVAVLICTLAYGCWRYRSAYITSGDTISHWAIVVKYMLRTRRFPDDSTQLIYFQSYPLGSAVFIYYVARLFGTGEPVYIVAQLFLYVCAYLPVFGLIKRNRLFGWTLSLAMLAFLLTFNISVTSLQVDSLLAFLTIGGAAALAGEWRTPRRAMPTVLSVIAALPFIKNSGVFFAAMLSGMLAHAVKKHPAQFKPRAALKTLLLCVGLIILTFGLWEAHAKIAYAGVLSSKHSVSLQYYSETVAGKSGELIRTVAKKMARRLLRPSTSYCWLLLMAVLSFTGCWWSIRTSGDDRAVWMKRLRSAVVGFVGLIVVWYALIFMMYVFSMTPKEARGLASISRYEKTIIACVCGGAAIFQLCWFCRPEGGETSRDKGLMVVLAAAVALLATLGFGNPRQSALAQLVREPERRPKIFEPVLAIEDKYDLEAEKSYLVFTRHDVFPLHTALYTLKYDCYSNDIMLLVGGIDEENYDYEAYYTFRNTYMHNTDCERVDDLTAVLRQYADQYDYVLVCVEDPAFEMALERYEGDTPVLRAW